MLLRDYVCAAEHVTEHLHQGSSSTAPKAIDCGTCGYPSEARLAAKVPRPGPLGELAQEYRRRGMAPPGV